jgi:hypothetical protein
MRRPRGPSRRFLIANEVIEILNNRGLGRIRKGNINNSRSSKRARQNTLPAV